MLTRIRVPAVSGFGQLTLIRPRRGAEIDCYDLLIEAICHQAAKDLRCKDLRWRIDAMDFFRSEWFDYITDYQLDGEMIINKLLET